MKVAVFLVLLAAAVFAQDELIDKLIIDDFTVGANQHSLEVELAANLEEGENSIIVDSSFNSPGCTGLVGCGRDMQLEVFSGFANREFTSDIFEIPYGYTFEAEWAVSNPKTSSSECRLQYDGTDGSFDLDLNGLGGIDVTDDGFTTDLFFSAVSDITIEYVVIFYDVDGGICELDVDIPATPGAYDYEETFFLFGLDEFSNGCDMTRIGAMEVFLPSDDAVDAIVRQIKLVGNPPPGNPPPASPPPPGGFTWYTFDDDDNGRSPCEDERPRVTYFVKDDNVIYYYFFGVNDGIDFGDSASSASMLSICVALIASVVAFIL